MITAKKTLAVLSFALTALFGWNSQAQEPQEVAPEPQQVQEQRPTDPFARSHDDSVENTAISRAWGVAYRPVPDLLRTHVEELQHDLGLLVCGTLEMDPPQHGYELRVGDIVLAMAGGRLRSTDPLPPPNGSDLTVLRGGRVIYVSCRRDTIGLLNHPAIRRHLGRHDLFGRGAVSTSASVSSVAGGNESVAVSQNGDQISLEISAPQLSEKPIRLRGTRQQILQQVDEAGYSPAIRRRVLQAIR